MPPRHHPTRPLHRAPARRTTTTDDGLTLIEMVVAVGVVTLVMLAGLSAFLTALKGQQVAEGTDRAIQIAQEQITKARQLNYHQVGFTDQAWSVGYPDDAYAPTAGEEDRREQQRFGIWWSEPAMPYGYARRSTPTNSVCLSIATTPAACPSADTELTYFLDDPTSNTVGRTNTVTRTNDDQTDTFADDLAPVTVDTRIPGTKFYIHTYITWAIPDGANYPGTSTSGGQTYPTGTPLNAAGIAYGTKRVLVRVSWTTGAAKHHIDAQTLISPRITDVLPPTITTPDPTTARGVPCPRSPAAGKDSLGRPVVSWRITDTAVTYKVIETRRGTRAVVATVPADQRTVYSVTLPNPGVEVTYKVIAINGAYSSVGCAEKPWSPTLPPSACPILYPITKPSATQARLTWTATTATTEYRIYRRAVGDTGLFTQVQTVAHPGTSVLDVPGPGGWDYRILPANEGGSNSACGNVANTQQVTF